MSLTSLVSGLKRNPVTTPQTSFQGAMDRFFDDWFRRDSDEYGLFAAQGFMPKVDVAERDKEWLVTAEMPGMGEKDIEIQLEGDRLVIKGERKEDKEEEKPNYYHRESRYGAFRREVLLPGEVIPDKVKAKFDQGVLRITLPKTPESRMHTRKIAVEAGA